MRTVASISASEAAQDAVLVEAADRRQLLVQLRAQLAPRARRPPSSQKRARKSSTSSRAVCGWAHSTSFWYAAVNVGAMMRR